MNKMMTMTTPWWASETAVGRIVAAAQQAERADPDTQPRTRWPWVERRRRNEWLEAVRAATQVRDALRADAIREAIQQARLTAPPEFPWQLPDADAVAAVLPACVLAGPLLAAQIEAAMYRDVTLASEDPDDRELLQQAAATYSSAGLTALQERSYITRPHSSPGASPLSNTASGFLASPEALLSRSVTVWRGEQPARDAAFEDAVRHARKSDLLHRGVVSSSLSPTVAARAEYTGGSTRDGRESGWLLQIHTDRALYAGSRHELIGGPQGLQDELEVLIDVPTLRVDRVYEALVLGEWRDKRLQVVECTALHPTS